MGIGNFSSRAKTFDHIPCEDCCVSSPYDVIIEDGDQFTFLNSLGTFLQRRYLTESNSIACAIPRADDYDLNIANFVSSVLGVKDRKTWTKSLALFLKTYQ
ncbi:hypothetical protein M9H77_07531 [Catharanthus roseus]|uniref:Uncharacterized protein n=1 Tax=Catharanthus roseus TaxID=4058 RepID=A0ACC0BVB0_CATRO|nr:hypothetical protein M9H77_07531 [Catharanthus roseus]